MAEYNNINTIKNLVGVNVKNNNVGLFKIAATYIGTVVGAGFASGQEVLQFFSVFGLKGLYGLIIVTVLFIFFGYTTLYLGNKLNAMSHIEVIRFSCGKFAGTVIDVIITIFLFGALSAMIAGAGAIFEQQFNLSPLLGTALMAIVTFITVVTGISGVINAISTVVPFLLGSVIFVAIYTIVINPVTMSDLMAAANFEGAAPNWVISAVNYASYNLIIAVAVLAPLGVRVSKKSDLILGAIFGGVGLGVGASCIYLAVLTNISELGNVEIPMIKTALDISIKIQIMYSIVLFAEVYTTAVGNLYGFAARISSFDSKRIKLVLITTTFAAFLVSQLGFSNMVRYLYPAVGYGGIIMFGGMSSFWLFKRKK